MSDSERAPVVEVPTSGSAPPARLFRLGIAPRLGFAFLAVTVLALTANLIAEHGASIIEASRLSAASVRPDATGSRAGQPSVTLRHAVAVAGSASFLSALADTDRAVRARIDANNALTAADLDRSQRALAEATAFYSQAVVGDDRVDRHALSRRAGTYRGAGAVAIRLADARRDLLDTYHQRLTSLDSAVTGAIDHSWTIFGRVIARDYLLTLGRKLDAMRQASAGLGSLTDRNAAPLKSLLESEAAFDSTLNANASSLRRSQGVQWESRVRSDFGDLVVERAAVLVAAEQVQIAFARLTTERNALAEVARPQPPAVVPAATKAAANPRTPIATPTEASPPATQLALPLSAGDSASMNSVTPVTPSMEVARARRLVEWITGIVLVSMLVTCVSTILSIVRPVRRLVEATRRMSKGGTVLVARGGLKELDGLAVAFNDMAQQLATARAADHAHQAKLEDKVYERTRALRQLAERDSLTQLPNRRDLLARLNAALKDATASGRKVGIYFLDLDNFKNVNDSLGHAFGDKVLQCVAQRLKDTAAPFGFAARLGGDEFTLVYPAATSATAIAEAGWLICQAFQEPLSIGDRRIKMSVSVGISVYPDHEQSAEALLRAADAALFRAKALGRSQLSVFSPDLLEAAISKFSIEQGLRQAIERGEFELAFQPEVSLASRTPTLVEALLRWRTPTGQLLAPGEFLGVAEESGLILDINDWVLFKAIETAAKWHFGEWPAVRIAINVSARQLLDAQFVDRVCELLRQHRLPASCIELELTENVLQTGPATIEALRQLHSHGIAIALDDFGTGYSSLSSLELLPLTRVKLDRSLISSIDTSSVSRAIAGAIIGLCRELHLDVTAEGVERPEQLAILSSIQAMHVQGYLLSHPLPGDRLLAELESLPVRMRSLLPTHGPEGSGNPIERPAAAQDARRRTARG